MKLKYALDEKVFTSKEAFDKSVHMVRNKELEVDDLKLLIDGRIASLYSDLKAMFPYRKSDFHSIYKRETVTDYIDRWYGNKLDITYQYFNILLDNGIVSVCGSGYMFDYKENEENIMGKNREKRIELLFKRRIAI